MALSPDRAEPYALRAAAAVGRQDFTRAIADSTVAIRRDPASAQAYVNRGAAYHRKGDLAAAIADYDKAVELDFGLAAAWYNRGVALYEQGLQKGSRMAASPTGPSAAAVRPAVSDLSRAIALDPKNADAYFNRGVAQFAQSDMAAALADFEKVLELDPANADARRYRDLAQERRR
jgi:tetratricopeptide (TPR) repeat protein